MAMRWRRAAALRRAAPARPSLPRPPSPLDPGRAGVRAEDHPCNPVPTSARPCSPSHWPCPRCRGAIRRRPGPATDLDRLVVTATRTAITADAALAAVEVIDRDQIERSSALAA